MGAAGPYFRGRAQAVAKTRGTERIFKCITIGLAFLYARSLEFGFSAAAEPERTQAARRAPITDQAQAARRAPIADQAQAAHRAPGVRFSIPEFIQAEREPMPEPPTQAQDLIGLLAAAMTMQQQMAPPPTHRGHRGGKGIHKGNPGNQKGIGGGQDAAGKNGPAGKGCAVGMNAVGKGGSPTSGKGTAGKPFNVPPPPPAPVRTPSDPAQAAGAPASSSSASSSSATPPGVQPPGAQPPQQDPMRHSQNLGVSSPCA